MVLHTAIFQSLVILVTSSAQLEYTDDPSTTYITKRALQKSHEKPRIQKLSELFLEKDFYSDDPDASLINLLNEIAEQYLSDCTTVILYDNFTENQDRVFLMKFFQQYPLNYIHGSIPADYHMQIRKLVTESNKQCVSFIIFIKDVMMCKDVISQTKEKVVIVAKSSQWRVQEYLSSEYSQEMANLLIIVKSDKMFPQKEEAPYILYTHKLYVDALGSSQPVVLTSWVGGAFTRNVVLFQEKLGHGFSGHRFIIATAEQVPYVIKTRKNEKDENEYHGSEVKLVELLSKMYNFSTDFKESDDIKSLGSGEAVIKALKKGGVNLGIGGIYITEKRYQAGVFHWHSQDCAAFISLASTALPRYRAIMGPFQWSVWLALIMVYMGAIFLFTFSDKLTLKHLIKSPEEIENMFWYVFGTFTNCFTFNSKTSWTKAQKNTTKILIGIYWLFTIIITACYTGSIIAFVTLPVFPEVVDTLEQLLGGRFQIGMLDKGGWPQWFHNVSDKTSKKLLKKVDFVPDVASGLKNVTKAFFWPYALLGSREELNFIVQTNFSIESKRSKLHIASQCFVPFKVGILLPAHSVYSDILERGIQRILQSGLADKIKRDVEWETLKSSTGKLLAISSGSGRLQFLSQEDRALTLDDTQGMFLLLGIGFLAGGSVLLSEIFGGCLNICKKSSYSKATSANSSIPSNPRFHERQTTTGRLRSISFVRFPPRRNSQQCSEEKDDKLNAEEQFGESLVHTDINKITTLKEHADSSEASRSVSTGSMLDYNEEISKMFDEALENGSYGSNESIKTEENKENKKKTI